MNEYLAPEPPTDADAVFRNFMRHNLTHAADHFDVTIASPPIFGWRLRSISALVRTRDGEHWLRVVSQEREWACGDAWTGNLDANVITGVPKPRVRDVHEWSEGDWRDQRAELMTLMPGEVCSPTDALRHDLELPEGWWAELRRCVDRVRATPTERVNADQEKVRQRLGEFFGDRVDLDGLRWETVHGDLHWNNLLQPDFGILDWELWGRGPAGTDAATLFCYSLLAPNMTGRVHDTFADVLDSPTGRIAQLFVACRLLRRIEQGDYPDLAEPLREHARSLLTSPR
jgi:hypothetical protein